MRASIQDDIQYSRSQFKEHIQLTQSDNTALDTISLLGAHIRLVSLLLQFNTGLPGKSFSTLSKWAVIRV